MEVRVLGPPDVVGDDGSALLLAAKQRRLLAALAADPGKTRTVDALIDALWPEGPPRAAAKALQVYVSRLRKALPEGIRIRTEASGYTLELEQDALDAARFERLLAEARIALAEENAALAVSLLGRALSLWRGRAFGELAYEDFVRAEAERLEELRLLALEEQSEAQLRLGRHSAVVGNLRELAVAHPLRERMQAQLMLALYRCGRQTEALDVYTSLGERLREQLGLEPGGELRVLQRRILQHDPTLALARTTAEQTQVALPAPPNRLLGRGRELTELRRLLLDERVRLLVLTGAGGSGKTRLALEVGIRTADAFANGACFVELAPVRDPEHMPGAIARALALEAVPGADPLDALADALRSRELLLIVDNAEHLRAGAPLYTRLLAQAPRLTLLVTSRTVLHVSGEHVYPVEPLTQPAAITLFKERAREADSRFHPTSEDEQAIRQICRQLDWLPLALELAASRTRTLTPRELLDRLEPRIPLLTGGPRDLPARQQTLRATLDWSYDLLDKDEQRDLRRLAVFAGGCTLEAAEVVCEARVDTLQSLVDKSIIRREGARFTMLETIREYAVEQLENSRQAEQVEAETVRHRHATWCCALVERRLGLVGDDRRGLDIEEDEERVLDERDNIQAALGWAWRTGEDELALRLGSACIRFWGRSGRHLRRGHGDPGLFRDAKAWLEAAEKKLPAASAPVQLQALKVAGLIAFVEADSAEADRYWAQALALAEQLDEPAEVAWVESRRAGVVWERGDLEQGLVLREAALAAAKATGPQFAVADELHMIGEVLRDLGRFEEAADALLRAREIAREIGYDWLLAANAHSLGDLDLDRADPAAAVRWYHESLDTGIRREHPIIQLLCIAGIAAAFSDLARDRDAATLWGAACAAEEAHGFQIPPPERRRYESRLRCLEGTDDWRAGRKLSIDSAVTLVSAS